MISSIRSCIQPFVAPAFNFVAKDSTLYFNRFCFRRPQTVLFLCRCKQRTCQLPQHSPSAPDLFWPSGPWNWISCVFRIWLSFIIVDVFVVVVDYCCCCCCFILEHLHCAWTFLCVPISVLLVAHSQLLELVDNFRIAFCERLQRWVFRSNTCVGEFSSLTFNMSGQKATNSSIQVLMLVINLCEKCWCWKVKESQRRLFCKNYT